MIRIISIATSKRYRCIIRTLYKTCFIQSYVHGNSARTITRQFCSVKLWGAISTPTHSSMVCLFHHIRILYQQSCPMNPRSWGNSIPLWSYRHLPLCMLFDVTIYGIFRAASVSQVFFSKSQNHLHMTQISHQLTYFSIQHFITYFIGHHQEACDESSVEKGRRLWYVSHGKK